MSPEQVTRDFYSFLAASDHRTTAGRDNHWVTSPDIGTDVSAQRRWLSEDLRECLRRANESIRKHHPKSGGIPIPEFNGASFRFAWDPPEKLVVTHTTKTPLNAIVAGVMIWGPKQQYAGNKRNVYFILVVEDGAWRIADIQADRYEFDHTTPSLRTILAAYR